ncbi:MAG: TetR/AcrR family transcriptional regulator [Chloroflexota bacterium]
MESPKDFKEQMVEARQAQILMGAAQVFSQKGYHKATTKAIAKAAGVSEGTIYNYFDNKRDLLLAMIRYIGSQTLQPVLEETVDADPKVALTKILKERYQLISSRGSFMAPIVAEVFSDESLREAVYQQVGMPVLAKIEEVFQQNIEAGRFQPLNPVIVARSLMGAIIINSSLKLTELDPRYNGIDSDDLISEIVSLFVDGLLIRDNGEQPK